MRPVIGPAQAVVKSSTRRPARGPRGSARVAAPAASRTFAIGFGSCSPSRRRAPGDAPRRAAQAKRRAKDRPRSRGRLDALPVVSLDQVRRAVPELHRRVGLCRGDALLQQTIEQLVAGHLAHAILHARHQRRPVVLPLLALGEARILLQLADVRCLAEAAPHVQMHPDADPAVGALHHHERRAPFAARVLHPAVGIFDRRRRRHRRRVHRHVERDLLPLPDRLARKERGEHRDVERRHLSRTARDGRRHRAARDRRSR